MHILYLYKYKFSICINTNLYLYLYRYKFVFQQLHHLLLLLYLLHSFVRQTKFSFQEDTRCLYLDVIPVTTFHAVFRIFCLRFTQNMFILSYLTLPHLPFVWFSLLQPLHYPLRHFFHSLRLEKDGT